MTGAGPQDWDSVDRLKYAVGHSIGAYHRFRHFGISASSGEYQMVSSQSQSGIPTVLTRKTPILLCPEAVNLSPMLNISTMHLLIAKFPLFLVKLPHVSLV